MISNNRKTISKAGLPLCTIFVVSTISIFFNPYEIFGSTYTNIGIIIVYLACLLYGLIAAKSSISKYQINLFILLFLILFLNFRNALVMSSVGLLSLTVLLKKEVFFPIILVDLIHSFITLYFIYDFLGKGNLLPLGELYVLPGQTDPNFSSYTLFLYFLFSVRIKSLLGTLFAIYLGLLSLSRAYSLSIFSFLILFAILPFFLKNHFFNKITRKFSSIFSFLPDRKRLLFVYIVLFANLLIYAYGSVLSSTLEGNSVSRFDIERLYTISSGDDHRFIANQAYAEYFLKNPEVLLRGDASLSIDTKYTGGLTVPHNGLIFETILLGFPFLIVYLIILSSILSKFDYYSNLAFIITPFIFSLFLHTGFSINQNIFVFCLISMANNTHKQFWLINIPFASFIFILLPRRAISSPRELKDRKISG